MLRACVLDFKENWNDHLLLIEFACTNSSYSSIKIAHFEALYGRRYRSLMGQFEVGEVGLISLELVFDVIEKVRFVRQRLKGSAKLSKIVFECKKMVLELDFNDWVYLNFFS